MAIKLAEKNSGSCLVICPKSIKEQWQEEVIQFKKVKWTVMTKEEFRRDHLKVSKFNLVIIDEAHYFSSPKSKMFKSLLKYLRTNKPEYIYLLTATPFTSSPWQVHTLARLLGHTWHYIKWRDMFFTNIRMGARLIPVMNKKVAEFRTDGVTFIRYVSVQDKIAEFVHKLGNTVRLDECIDVPDQVYQKERFQLTTEQIRGLNMVEEDQSVNYIVKWTKRHEIIGGTLKSDGYREDQFFKSEKLNRLVDLCGEHNKIIVVCRYNAEIDMIARTINKKYKNKPVFKMTGKVKEIDKTRKLDEYVLIANASVSEGWEAPDVPLMIFYSYSFSLKDYLQIKGRILRINKPTKNVYLSLIVPNTVDEDVYKCIQRKKSFDVAIYAKEHLS